MTEELETRQSLFQFYPKHGTPDMVPVDVTWSQMWEAWVPRQVWQRHTPLYAGFPPLDQIAARAITVMTFERVDMIVVVRGKRHHVFYYREVAR